MPRKKLLIISPTPTHPQNAGNRMRVFSLTNALKSFGFEVHFLFVEMEKGDKEAMNRYWQDRVYYFTRGMKIPASPPLTIFKRVLYRARYSADEVRYNFHADDWYDINLDDFVLTLQSKEKFDIVVVEYIFFSKAFLNFGPEVLKILDTHDIFTNRFQLYLRHNQTPQWFSTYEKEEARALNRADLIIAIQSGEKNYFSKLSDKKVIQTGYIMCFREARNESFAKKLLFVASGNPINRDGINFFIDEVLGKLRSRYPDVELIIAGSISGHVAPGDGIRVRGEFDDPLEVYQEADIVINPVRFSTGLNIKTVEALSYGKLLVSTASGTAGLEQGINRAFVVADTADQFLEAIADLIEDQGRRETLMRNAGAFIEEYSQKNLEELKHALRAGGHLYQS